MPYHHRVSTHHRSKRARRFRKVAMIGSLVFLFAVVGVGVDWLLTSIRSTQTTVSSESSATVQSARINIFQPPYFQFQAESSWREVTDELNLADSNKGTTRQYLYRSFDKNFIEHELWVTVNLPENYQLEKHNIPTRIVPVRVEPDGSLMQLDSVSDPCVKALPEGSRNVAPQVLVQYDISYYCNPNQVNDYTVTVGVPGGTNRLEMPHSDGEKAAISLTYRNITAIPDSSVFERLLRNFRSI